MAIESLVVQDLRGASRVCANLNCQFTVEGVSYQGIITNLSLEGGLLSSRFMPRMRSNITIALKTPLLKNTLIIEGTVIREHSSITDDSEPHRFGVWFSHAHWEIIKLINELIS